MAKLKYASSRHTSLLLLAAVVMYAMTAFAQGAKDACGPTPVIPITGKEPPAKIVTFAPLG